MLISRRAFRLLVALCIGTASAHSYATDQGWETGADAYPAPAVCPYGACHSGRDYLGDPAPAAIEATPVDAAPADSAATENLTADASATVTTATETSAAAPSAPAVSEAAEDRGCGYDGIHPAYGHPYYGHSYYQHLQYAHGHAGYGYDAPAAAPTSDAPVTTEDEAPVPEATAELTCEYPETSAPAATEPAADEPIAAESAIIEDEVPPTPSEEALPAAPQTALDDAPIASEEPVLSDATPEAVVELAEEPIATDDATPAPSSDEERSNTATSDSATSDTPVESLTPNPYPYGHGHPVYSSKGYPFHYDWEATANSNCDEDEALLQNSQASDAPIDANVEDHSDLLPASDLPNYDYPIETQPTAAEPAEESVPLDLDQFEHDGQWPVQPSITRGLIDNSIARLVQIASSVRDGIGQLEVPGWLVSGWESARNAAANLEATAISAEPEPEIDLQSDIGQSDLGAQRDAVIALAQSIDRLGLSLQQIARQMERIAEDDVIGRLGSPSDHLDR